MLKKKSPLATQRGLSTSNGKSLAPRFISEVEHKLVTVEEGDEDKSEKDMEKTIKDTEGNVDDNKSIDPPSRRASVTWGVVLTPSSGDEDKEVDDTQSLTDSQTVDLNSTHSDEESPPQGKQKKRRRLTLPKLFFPGLRKDSIAIYKDAKFLRSPDEINTPNGDSGFGQDDDDDDYPSDDDHEEYPAITLPSVPMSPTSSILKRRSSSIRMEKPVKDNFFTLLSGLYAMVVVTLGGVLPIAEVFADKIHAVYFEIYYLYMYGVSILFLGYVYIYLLGNRKITIGRILRRQESGSSTSSSVKKKSKKRKVSVDEVDSHTGSFYLRLGALAFGIGGMIHSGLQFGEFFDDFCQSGIYAARPLLHLTFTFVQLYFVFMNSKMCINRYKTIARFGLMHMVATNICVWLDTIVTETLHQSHVDTHSSSSHQSAGSHAPEHPTDQSGHSGELHSHNQSDHAKHVAEDIVYKVVTTISAVINESGHHLVNNDHHASSHGDITGAADIPRGSHCGGGHHNLMAGIVETAGPYLYPCTIEYSLICAGVLYTLWGNIGKRVMTYQPEEGEEEGTKQQRLSVDCSNSSRGLFLGIITLVGTVITMVMFFVLIESQRHYESGILVEYLTEIFLYLFSLAAVLIAAFRMRHLRFNATRDTDFEEILILISLGGEFMFALLSIIAACFEKNIYGSSLNIVAKLMAMVQASVQTLFVLNGLRRSARTSQQTRNKMGREFVTFLLISNISMWGVNTFALQRSVANPVQLHFYGALSWNILTHISIPLAIFFRFHSTVCLSNVWKRAWKGH